MLKKVSFYVPCFNSAKTIEKCILSIQKQTYPIDEIIAVDDGSTDNTLNILYRYDLRVISFTSNKGIANARNVAIKTCKNEYIASIDADCIINHNWLEIIMNAFQDDLIYAIGGKLTEINTSHIADRWRSIHMNQSWGSEPLYNPPFLCGCNTVIRKKAFTIAGIYNSRFITNYEDVDISKRFITHNLLMLYLPNAYVYHLKKDSILSLVNSFTKWNYFAHHNAYIYYSNIRLLCLFIGQLMYFLEINSNFIKNNIKQKEFKLLLIDMLFFPLSIYYLFVQYVIFIRRKRF